MQQDFLPYYFNALGDPTRYQIFQLLMETEGLCVSEIGEKLGLTPSAISQQFKVLEMTGLVQRKRVGQKICYEINESNPVVKSFMRLVRKN